MFCRITVSGAISIYIHVKKNPVWYLVFMFIVILIVPPFKGTTGNGQ